MLSATNPESGTVSYRYDPNGNLARKTDARSITTDFTYDELNRPTFRDYSDSTPDATYFYDGDGKRIKKVVGTETTIFVYDASGKLAAEYTLGITANPSPQTNYITADTLGSTRIVTNSASQIIARHDYLPFGDEIYGLGGRTSAQGFVQTDAIRRRFTGYERDLESGLDFAQARYYGHEIGRFTGVDPLAESAKLYNPQTMNRYVYVSNNPVRYVDPDGRQQQDPEPEKKKGWWERLVDYGHNMWTGTAAGNDGMLPGSGNGEPAKREVRGPFPSASSIARDSTKALGQGADVLLDVLTTIEPTGIAAGAVAASRGDKKGVVFAAAGALLHLPGGKNLVKWLGKGTRVIVNRAGDKVFLSRDGLRRIRFDIKNPKPHNNPHGHVEELVNGKWQKSGPIYPTNVPHN